MSSALRAAHHPDCYPSDPLEALGFFQNALETFGGQLPTPPTHGTCAGIITPHIDFRVSTRAYVAAFAPLLDLPLADTYLILGVGHRSPLEWNLDPRDYTTPLGHVPCTRELVEQLAAGSDLAELFAPEAHEQEHSIEFPLVWLQALHQLHPTERGKEFRFAPLLCGSLYSYVEGEIEWEEMHDFHRLAANLSALLAGLPPGNRLRLIVSIDGCHLGPRFQHQFKVTSAILKTTAAWEENLWACAAMGDARGFLDWFRAEGNDRYFDGVGALALLLAAGAGQLAIERTFYEQWPTPRDGSCVTFSSGRILANTR